MNRPLTRVVALGAGVLLLASIHNREIAVAALGLFALCTALSMAALSTGLGFTFERGRVGRVFPTLAPVLGVISLSFGVWYALVSRNLSMDEGTESLRGETPTAEPVSGS